jgi:hypothetical protein
MNEYKPTKRPQPKLLGLGSCFGIFRTIYFATDSIAAKEDLESFGIIRSGVGKGEYQIYVNLRYDFNEVVEYIKEKYQV